MFIVLSTFARVYLVRVMNTERHLAAANLWTKPTGLSRRPAYIGSQETVSTIRHLLLLLSLKGRESSYSFYHPTEG